MPECPLQGLFTVHTADPSLVALSRHGRVGGDPHRTLWSAEGAGGEGMGCLRPVTSAPRGSVKGESEREGRRTGEGSRLSEDGQLGVGLACIWWLMGRTRLGAQESRSLGRVPRR